MFPLGTPARLGGGPQRERPPAAGAISPGMPSPKHPACHFSIAVVSRADGRSSIAAAAYRAGRRLLDERTGRSCEYRRRTDVLSCELIGWKGSLGELWSDAEKAERRGDAREVEIALPAELSLGEMRRLVRGLCLWLRDQHGVACHAAIHEPRWHDPKERRRLRADRSEAGRAAYEAALRDPTRTNRNFHVHILMTTRAIDPATGAFGAKTRCWDARDEGPARIEDLRREWQKRANSALGKAGATARVDLRSYETQAAAGDAPPGLEAQDHLGPKWAALSRKMTTDDGEDGSRVGRRRAARRASSEETWTCWLQLRALERERARETRSAAIAAEREAERRAEAAAERARLETARTEKERAEAAAAAVHLTAPLRGNDALYAAIAAAQATGDGGAGDAAWKAAQRPVPKRSKEGDAVEDPALDFDIRIDPESYDLPRDAPSPDHQMRIIRRDRQRQRGRGG